MSHKKGFTLLEILLVVGIIAILTGIVILAINPARQLAQTRNTQRLSDIKQINNAIIQYYIDNNVYPSDLSTTSLTEICDTGTATSTEHTVDCDGLTDLSILVPIYLTTIPKDPLGASSTLTFIPTAYAATNGTGYKTMADNTNRIIITAPLAELDIFIAIGTTTSAITTTLGPVYISSLSGNFLDSENLIANISDFISTTTYKYSWYKDDSEVPSATTLITDALVSYWPLGNNTLDYFGENDGTNNGATQTFGQVGGAYSFDGVDDYIKVLDSDSLDFTNGLTISLWAQNTSSSRQNLVSKDVYGLMFDASNYLTAAVYNYGSNILNNTGFEAPYSSGVANSWIKDSGTGSTPSQETTIVHGGSSSQKWVSPGGYRGSISQSLSLVNGAVYHVNGWVYVASGAVCAFVQQLGGDYANYGGDCTSTVGKWVNIDFYTNGGTYVTPYIRLMDHNTATTVYFDDFVIQRVNNQLITESSESLEINTWRHLTLTFNGSELTLYINGDFDNMETSDAFSLSGSNHNLTIGSLFLGGSRFFNGSIDEVMIFNRSLSASEVKMLYEGSRLGGNTLGANQTTTGDNWITTVESNAIGGNNWMTIGTSAPVTIIP